MTGTKTQSDRLQGGRPGGCPGPASGWAIAALLGLALAGCAVQQPATCVAQQEEIERLQQLLAEKEALLGEQQLRQQEQAKALQEATAQAARTQMKLHRLATRPAAASAIAEAEVAMRSLKTFPLTGSERTLQSQAQRFLDAAAAAYAKGDYAVVMDRAAQAQGISDMMLDNRTRAAANSHYTMMPLQVPIPLRVRSNSNLRQEPRNGAAVLGILKKHAPLTAQAYWGNWLRVQASNGRTGWVFNMLVEAQTGEP